MAITHGGSTPLGGVEGIDTDAGTRTSLIEVSESLRSLGRGWQLLISTSRHHAAARMLATRPFRCDAVRPDASTRGRDAKEAALYDVAEAATRASFQQDIPALRRLAFD